MHVGFTGTRQRLTEQQVCTLERELQKLFGEGYHTFHHGDCVGADELAHSLAVRLGFRTEVHPPNKSEYQAHCEGDVVHTPKPYMQRNQDIVNASDILVATPKGPTEHRSGTWATINMARRADLGIIIIKSSGGTHKE